MIIQSDLGSLKRLRPNWHSVSWFGRVLALSLIVLVAAMPSTSAQQTSPQSEGSPETAGGAAQADFDLLIDLIQSTVAPESWAENGTGEGQIASFDINGVYADPDGTLRFTNRQTVNAPLRKIPQASESQNKTSSARHSSTLRYVSLRRLEAAIARRQHEHQPLSAEMLTLAGLRRVQYVMVYPETGDLVIAGPAGDWQVEPDGRIVGVENGLPVVRLDDLLTLWRRRESYNTSAFGCSISPRKTLLAKTQEYLGKSNLEPIEPEQRPDWLEGLRQSLGRQDVEFFGIAGDSHVARVLLVADYHMKLIGMGIADTVEGVSSYLDTVQLMADGSPPPMAVLRWWFAMNYEPVETDPQRNVFCLHGQSVQVLSENELLAARGQRVPTGQSEELNKRFASAFTAEYERICRRYPLYAELRNVFDLAMVLAIIDREGLAERAGWLPSLFSDSRRLGLPTKQVPQEVDTVINHRVIKGRHIVAGISGGVWLDAGKALKVRVSKEAHLAEMRRTQAKAEEPSSHPWWWD